MNAVSAGEGRAWVVSGDRPETLRVTLLKRTYILAWNQFLYAEGEDEEVLLVFASHDVRVRGSGLAALLDDVMTQRVSALAEPVRAERFIGAGSRRFIREIVVKEAEDG